MNKCKHLIVENYQHAAVIKIIQSPTRNLLDSALISELTDTCQMLNEDSEVKTIILTAKGDSFVAGADLKEIASLSVSQAYELARRTMKLHDLILQSTKLYIAAINGYCLGNGLELILTCDFRISSEHAVFGVPEINLGLIPGGGAITNLPAVVGRTAAADLIYTGRLVNSLEAKSMGLIGKVSRFPLNEALELAESLAEKSSLALSVAKQLFNESFKENSSLLNQEMRAFSILFDYPDSLEGMDAFLEQRKPVFRERPTMNNI